MSPFSSHQVSAVDTHVLERPKRPRTAYNYFFQDERQKLLVELPVRASGRPRGGTHGKIGFADLAKTISAKWRAITVDQMVHYAGLANADKMRYQHQMQAYKEQQRRSAEAAEATRQHTLTAEPVTTTEASASDVQDEDVQEPIPVVFRHNHFGTALPRQVVANNIDNMAMYPLSALEPDPIHMINRQTTNNLNTSPISDLVDQLDRQSIDILIAAFK